MVLAAACLWGSHAAALGLGRLAVQSALGESILEHLRDPELSVARVARDLTLSVRYVHKLFEAQGQQVMQWAQGQRLQACRRELASRRSRPVSDVAYAWGFASPSHFSRAFKRETGMSPSAWRQARQGG